MLSTPGGTVLGIGGAILCYVLAGLFWHAKWGKKIRLGKRHHPRICLVLVMAGSAGMAATKLGHLINSLGTKIADMISGVSAHWIGGLTTSLIITIFVVVLTYQLVVHLMENHVDGDSLWCAFLLPFFIAAVPGTAGTILSTIVAWIAFFPAMVISAVFGI